MSTDTTFQSLVDDALQVKVYGKKVEDLTLTARKDSFFASQYGGGPLTFVLVFGVRFLGKCRTLPVPLLIPLPGEGTAPTGCCEFKDQLMWVIPKGSPLVALTQSVVTAEDLAASLTQPRLDVDSNFTLSNVRIDGNTVKGHLRAYLRLHQSTPFGPINIVVIDRNDDFAFPLPDICVTVFSIAVASAQVCLRENPRRLCGEVSVGVDLPFGLGQFSQNFPIACVQF